MVIHRQVRIFGGILVLQWNNKSSLLKWFCHGQTSHNKVSLKNLIKFRGFLREYCRDVRKLVCDTGTPALVPDEKLFGTKMNIITHVDDLYARIRFVTKNGNGVGDNGYLTLQESEDSLRKMARSINLLFEEHHLKGKEEEWKRDKNDWDMSV